MKKWNMKVKSDACWINCIERLTNVTTSWNISVYETEENLWLGTFEKLAHKFWLASTSLAINTGCLNASRNFHTHFKSNEDILPILGNYLL